MNGKGCRALQLLRLTYFHVHRFKSLTKTEGLDIYIDLGHRALQLYKAKNFAKTLGVEPCNNLPSV